MKQARPLLYPSPTRPSVGYWLTGTTVGYDPSYCFFPMILFLLSAQELCSGCTQALTYGQIRWFGLLLRGLGEGGWKLALGSCGPCVVGVHTVECPCGFFIYFLIIWSYNKFYWTLSTCFVSAWVLRMLGVLVIRECWEQMRSLTIELRV